MTILELRDELNEFLKTEAPDTTIYLFAESGIRPIYFIAKLDDGKVAVGDYNEEEMGVPNTQSEMPFLPEVEIMPNLKEIDAEFDREDPRTV